MAFFTPKPNLPNGEKARIEFYIQQIIECIGFDRFKLPVVAVDRFLDPTLMGSSSSNKTPEDVLRLVGDHLNHSTGEIRLVIDPQQPEKCGGGG